MNKLEKIDYLNSIVKYLNLSAICNLYNQINSENKIDYNNMRVVLKKQYLNRLSEVKIDSFIDFIHSYLIDEIFQHTYKYEEFCRNNIRNKVKSEIKKFSDSILEVVDNEI